MILQIEGRDRHLYPEVIDQLHRLRKRVFYDRLKWNVPIIGPWEIDGYDALNPLYVLSINDDGEVAGGLRLLPTTGFTMLNDTFPELLPSHERVENPSIWESSRFVALKNGVRVELALAMNRIGMERGWTHVVTVYDMLLHKLLERDGCEGELLSPPKMIGNVTTCLVKWEIGEQLETRLKNNSVFRERVLIDA